MADPYVGEIRMFGGNYAPQGWAFCDGSILPIDQNDVLFTLIGTTYGGDGQQTFALPNFQGRIPVQQGSLNGTPYTLGQVAGTETVTLTTTQLASHQHPIQASSNNGSSPTPTGNIVASTSLNPYVQGAPLDLAMGNQIIGVAGSGLPHDNMMPYLCITFIISLFGIFPSQN